MLSQIMLLADDALRAETPEAATGSFFAAASRMGATYIQTRLYRRPAERLTSRTHWAAGGFIKRIAPAGWPGSAAFNYICFECNPLLGAIRENRTGYRFSDFAPHDDPAYGAYWEALAEAGISEALCATSYGAAGAIASLHLGFGQRAVDAATARAVQMAGLMLTERLMDLAGAPGDDFPALTPRERDCLAYIAEGRRDREIAAMLGISDVTVRFHIDNARRKLGVSSRSQAVAGLANLRLL